MIQFAVVMILLHAPGGAIIEINPEQVTSLREKHESNEHTVTKEANCQVSLVDGKFVLVVEPCYQVRKMIEGQK